MRGHRPCPPDPGRPTLRAGFVLTTALAGCSAPARLPRLLADHPRRGRGRSGRARRRRPRRPARDHVGDPLAARRSRDWPRSASSPRPATVFGFGWFVVVVAGADPARRAGLVVAPGPGLGAAAGLRPVPSVVVIAASGVHVTPQVGDRSFAPRTPTPTSPRRGYESGLGDDGLVPTCAAPGPAVGRGHHHDPRRPAPHDPGAACTTAAWRSTSTTTCTRSRRGRRERLLTGDADPYESVTAFGDRALRARRPDRLAPPRGTSTPGRPCTSGSTRRAAACSLRDYPDDVDPQAQPGLARLSRPRGRGQAGRGRARQGGARPREIARLARAGEAGAQAGRARRKRFIDPDRASPRWSRRRSDERHDGARCPR